MQKKERKKKVISEKKKIYILSYRFLQINSSNYKKIN